MFWDDDLAPGWTPPQFDESRPHPYRMYNYLIGGKDHFQVDRDAADMLVKARPDTMVSVRAVEAFSSRAVTVLAEAGIRQFLQLGTAIAIPNSSDNIARNTNPDSRFVYVADDPITTAHARALLVGRPDTQVLVIADDFRRAGRVLEREDLAAALDFDQPVGFLLFGMLDYIRDAAQARASLDALYEAAAPGSLIALLHVLEVGRPDVDAELAASLAQDDIELTPRPAAAVRDLLAGYEFLEPGLVPLPRWRPNQVGPAPELGERAGVLGGVIVKR
jgi:S-adenosyl methyltransferase